MCDFFERALTLLRLRVRKATSVRGLNIEAVRKSTDLQKSEVDRFLDARRLYLETSAFNHIVDNYDLATIELTRAYQRRKGVIFVASPMLLWEIMLISDRDRADMMLLAAQAMFDPILLATPTELTVRYLRNAYPENTVNYSFFTNLEWVDLWRDMTTDFGKTISYDLGDLMRKTKSLRIISKNLSFVIENRVHEDETVKLITTFVSSIHAALREDLNLLDVDDVAAKFVILYVLLLLLLSTDLESSEADALWTEKGFTGDLDSEQITHIFLDYPEVFRRGPVLEMANMVALQYREGKTNRGALHDGMHMIYAPYVDAIFSNDEAFLKLSKQNPFYQNRVFHLSQLRFADVELSLTDYPNDQKFRSL